MFDLKPPKPNKINHHLSSQSDANKENQQLNSNSFNEYIQNFKQQQEHDLKVKKQTITIENLQLQLQQLKCDFDSVRLEREALKNEKKWLQRQLADQQ